MTIQLEAPYTQSDRNDRTALTAAPMFGRNRKMSRWHIPRTGTVYANGRIVYGVWCSASYLTVGKSLMVDEIPSDDTTPICGTCVGRAVGAGHSLPIVSVEHEGGLVFEPRYIRTPRVCPGSKLTAWHHVNDRIGRCFVCGEYETISGGSRGYGWIAPHLRMHAPADGLVKPCPFHAWDRITAEGRCSCGHEPIEVTR